MNIGNLTKEEIIKRHNFRCIHSHTGLEHQNCYDEHFQIKKKRAFLDIETSNLHADFGYLFSYVLLGEDGKRYERILTSDEIRKHIFDKNLIMQFCKDISNYERIFVYWGKSGRHDLPFLLTRALVWGEEIPNTIYVTDIYDVIKMKLRLHRNRLENACQLFNIPAKEHRLDPNTWQKAMSGDARSLNYILLHNREDCESLKNLWHKIERYTKLTKTSI